MNRLSFMSSLLRLIAALPLSWVHRLGAFSGWLLWRIPSNRSRQTAERNLALCFPERSDTERNRLLRQSLMEAGKGFLELGPLWFWHSARVLELIRESAASEAALAAAVDRKQGVMLITPHLGSWEMAGLYYSSRYPLTILYRPSRLAEFDVLSRQGRGRMGGQAVATGTQGLRALLKALQQGKVLGILPDQDIGSDDGEVVTGRVFAPFFGIAASTMTLVSRLAQKTGAEVFLTWAERLPHGQGYALHLRALPEVTEAATLEESVVALNQGIEAAVRTLPGQYLWAYRRFRTRPPGESRIY
ncbi:MAG TPA: lysophospholipid acyltransferase family protein [Candidatus Competibacteraceae bacterium]|nr:lysophospholipid acyltransferase family protein [Candidatus Competibacteraceae bacterium]MCP5135059.1 lysophospholipid acyltransferase family protein [Gammaproteobacteria bacterium]HPF59394.1 lysophospholipid acyltransferase family protein [Candidatus Competibacteraceae bacterium]HRY18898.1 lysophospholipid acyltransferase family protein [Candidatus Competibacteraceae bacterium]